MPGQELTHTICNPKAAAKTSQSSPLTSASRYQDQLGIFGRAPFAKLRCQHVDARTVCVARDASSAARQYWLCHWDLVDSEYLASHHDTALAWHSRCTCASRIFTEDRFTLEGRRMKKLGLKIVGCVTVAIAFASLAAAPALAQSSGNFTYGSNGGTTHCVLQSGGQITGGQICESSCALQPDGTVTCSGQGNGLCVGSLAAGIKTSSGNGNVFVMRPSAVIGLLTDVSLVKSSTTSV